MPEDLRSPMLNFAKRDGDPLDLRAAELHDRALAVSNEMEALSKELEDAGRHWPSKLALAAATYVGCACDQLVIAVEGVPGGGEG